MAHLTPEEFGETFDEVFTRSAFRLEVLDRYVAANETEPLRRFRSGLPQSPAWREPWARFVRESLRAGKHMSRVHVVREPLSDYLEFELTCAYPANVAAGEDVRILQVPPHEWPLGLPSHDYWLFDDREVAVMLYDGGGNFLGADTITDPFALAGHCEARDVAMRRSVSLANYLTSLGMKEAV